MEELGLEEGLKSVPPMRTVAHRPRGNGDRGDRFPGFVRALLKPSIGTAGFVTDRSFLFLAADSRVVQLLASCDRSDIADTDRPEVLGCVGLR